FATRIKEPTAADRRKDQRHGQRCAEYRRAQIAGRCRIGTTRSECYSLERAAICAQSQFGFRPAIDVIEYRPGKPTFGDAPQIFNIDNVWRLNAGADHLLIITIEERKVNAGNGGSQ